MADYTGTSGDDTQVGSAFEDTFDFTQGGHDTLWGGDGDDSFYMGAALDASDSIDGGDQINLDSVEIGGDYSAGLTITSSMMTGIEGLELEAGTYRLKIADGVAGDFFIIGMLPGCTSVLDASAVTSAALNISDNIGVVTRAISGGGDDRFEIYAAERKDVLIGGEGDDQLTVQYAQDFRLAGHSFSGFETLRLVTTHKVTLADGNVAAGEVLTVNGFYGVGMDFDGHKEADGHFEVNGLDQGDRMVGGQLYDSIDGGAGDDTIVGGGGADVLTGGTGADVFAFAVAHHSWSGEADLITDLEDGDSIDLSAIDASQKEDGNQAFRLVTQFSGHAGELLISYDADSGRTIFSGDVNGDGAADLVIQAQGDHTAFAGLVL